MNSACAIQRTRCGTSSLSSIDRTSFANMGFSPSGVTRAIVLARAARKRDRVGTRMREDCLRRIGRTLTEGLVAMPRRISRSALRFHADRCVRYASGAGASHRARHPETAMPHYAPPLRDMQFVLYELLGVEKALSKLPAHAGIDRATIDAVLEEGGKFCAEVLFPLNQVGDREGCKYAGGGVVTTPSGFKEAYRRFTDGGWSSLAADTEFGGQGLPHVVHG